MCSCSWNCSSNYKIDLFHLVCKLSSFIKSQSRWFIKLLDKVIKFLVHPCHHGECTTKCSHHGSITGSYWEIFIERCMYNGYTLYRYVHYFNQSSCPWRPIWSQANILLSLLLLFQRMFANWEVRKIPSTTDEWTLIYLIFLLNIMLNIYSQINTIFVENRNIKKQHNIFSASLLDITVQTLALSNTVCPSNLTYPDHISHGAWVRETTNRNKEYFKKICTKTD